METAPYLPHEVVVSKILVHLPVKSLLRFKSIDEGSFHRAHRRLQDTSVLIALKVKNEDHDDDSWTSKKIIAAGLYRWDRESRQPRDAASLVCAASDGHSFFSVEKQLRHNPAHCDGLVLLPADDMVPVRVLNPATRRVLELPGSPRAAVPGHLPRGLPGHQAFGLGHDPRSGTCKVFRFFYRSVLAKEVASTGSYSFGMEVFTIGRDECWRDTATPPPYPIIPARTATFYKGSLLWTVEESLLPGDVPGFVRLKLEDESFGVMPPPPRRPRLDYAASSLAELRGELCLCVCVAQPAGSQYGTLEMWMWSGDLDDVAQMHWDRRYILTDMPIFPKYQVFRLIVVFDEEIVFEAEPSYLLRYNITQRFFTDAVTMKALRYCKSHSNAVDEYPTETIHICDAIPYVPSFFPL